MINSFHESNIAKYIDWSKFQHDNTLSEAFVLDNATYIASSHPALQAFFHTQLHLPLQVIQTVLSKCNDKDSLYEILKKLLQYNTDKDSKPESTYYKYKMFYTSDLGETIITSFAPYIDISKFIFSVSYYKAPHTLIISAIDAYKGDETKQALAASLAKSYKRLTISDYKYIDETYNINSGNHITWDTVSDTSVLDHYVSQVKWTAFFNGRFSKLEATSNPQRYDLAKFQTAIAPLSDYMKYVPLINHMCASNIAVAVARYCGKLHNNYTNDNIEPLLDIVHKIKHIDKINWDKIATLALHPMFIDTFEPYLDINKLLQQNKHKTKSLVIARYKALSEF